jgi:hypothetical protein
MPPAFFLKKKFKKKTKKIYKYMLGWPNHPIGGGRPPRFLFFILDFFFLKKKSARGILGINRAKWVKLPQFESLGGGVKCHILNFGGKSENEWIFQEDKV